MFRTFCMLIVTLKGLIEQLTSGVNALFRAQPIHFVADVPEGLSCRESTLITACQTLHVELIGFLGSFGDEVIPRLSTLRVELSPYGLYRYRPRSMNAWYSKAIRFRQSPWGERQREGPFVFRVLLTPLISGRVITPDEVLFQSIELVTHIIEFSSNFIDLLYRYGKTVHERHTEFQQETASFCFQTMEAFQLRRITDFYYRAVQSSRGFLHSQLQVRQRSNGFGRSRCRSQRE